MNEPFEIPVYYKGKELSFSDKFVQFGYAYKIIVDVEGQEISFEPDEERNFRAVIEYEKVDLSKKNDPDLLKTIAETIEAIVK